MMGDDMAIRSGGMYGNPESNYTIARPTSVAGGGGLSMFGRGVKAMFGVGAAYGNYLAEESQIATDIRSLRKEREYNTKNFQQYIADTFAQNKMSFYSSGLDIKSGTAQDVIRENRRALTEDLAYMTYKYDTKERELKERAKDARSAMRLNVASSIISMF